MNEDIKHTFPGLAKYCRYIIDNKLEEFVTDQLQILKEENPPLMEYIKNIPEDELLKQSIGNNLENFLEPMSEGKGYEIAVDSVQKWKDYIKYDPNPINISMSDLIIGYYTRKISLFRFLPGFEPFSFAMIKEIEDFTKVCEELAFQTFIEIFEQKMLDRELFVQKLADASPNILYDFDLQTNTARYISKKVEAVLGYNVEQFKDILENHPNELVHPDSMGEINDYHEKRKHGDNDVLVFEYQVKHADGSWRWLRRYESIFRRDAEGQPAELAGSLVDVTDKKKDEAELKQLNKNLEKRVKSQTEEIKKSYDQLKKVLESLPQMAWTADGKGKVDYYSEAWEKYLGKSFEELRKEGWQEAVHPDDMARTMHVWNEKIKGSKEFKIENRLLRASDQMYRWHLSIAVPLKDHLGKVAKWVGTTTDIHDQKELTESLERKVNTRTSELLLSNIELARSNKDLEQFAYVASHDLKEPLRMISSYLQLLSKSMQGHLNAEQQEFLSFINSGADRMNALIGDLLNYSRIYKDPSAIKKVDCNHVLDMVKLNLSGIMEETEAKINSDKLPVITGIESQLIQLFQNLIANAIKFRKPDVPPEIDIRVIAEQHEWFFSISDNGIGIAPQFKDKIFIIFQRLHTRDQYPGTGIGLSVCKKIVELYGGKIWFDSTPGVGSTFYFTLPKNINLNKPSSDK